MKALLLMLLAAISLMGCDRPVAQLATHSWQINQQERQRIFKDCLASIPKGPESTVYNDWAEVVAECGTQAEHQSMEWKPKQ